MFKYYLLLCSQVIAFLHTMMGNYETTNFSTALIVCPLNTVLNWQNEVNMWLEDNEVQLEVGLYIRYVEFFQDDHILT